MCRGDFKAGTGRYTGSRRLTTQDAALVDVAEVSLDRLMNWMLWEEGYGGYVRLDVVVVEKLTKSFCFLTWRTRMRQLGAATLLLVMAQEIECRIGYRLCVSSVIFKLGIPNDRTDRLELIFLKNYEGWRYRKDRECQDPAFRRAGRLPNLRYGDQVRAVWVTRYDFENEEDIVNIMKRSAQLGFNTVFFQVRGNASTYYRSKLEPWSETYNWQNPGYDPLLLAVQEAHTRSMSLHAWINVMPMWRGSFPPSNKDHIFWTHPEWSWYDKHGTRQPLNRGFYVSINPCLPEPRSHIVQVCQEIVSCYEIDGLHLDYIRFPNEPPVVKGDEYPHDKTTLELFQSDTGFGAERDQIYGTMTAAVGAERLNALSHFQDVERWWKERLLDAVVPMNYTGCHRTFRRRIEHDWLEKTKERLIFPLSRMFLGEGRHERHTPVQLVNDNLPAEWSRPPEPAVVMGISVESGDCKLHQKQLALALQRFGHFSVFSYSSLFDQGSYEERLRPLHIFLRILGDASRPSLQAESSQFPHPFRDRITSAHPEEDSPYDYFNIRNQVEPSASNASPEPIVMQWRSRRKGKRFISGAEGNNQKDHRRTGRRRLLVKDKSRKRRAKMGVSRDDESYVSRFNRVESILERSGVEETKNWEAIRMAEATRAEEQHTVQSYALEGLMRDIQGKGKSVGPTSPLCAISTQLITSNQLVLPSGLNGSHLTRKVGAIFEGVGKGAWSKLRVFQTPVSREVD
ncbi:hypothetical protein R1flu_005799 [Riccia fluitans]|uniref:Glycosyl hydrolase-like 10 domain-containing protein n=1 Tax=Riccia fluitans TaxID=41844 RepID=A0ABD1YUF4_9MARC